MTNNELNEYHTMEEEMLQYACDCEEQGYEPDTIAYFGHDYWERFKELDKKYWAYIKECAENTVWYYPLVIR